MPVLGPFPKTLRNTDFTDQTAAAGVSSSVYSPFASYRIPLGQSFEFLPSTQFTPQQHHVAQNFVTTASGQPAASGAAGFRLERRDATGQLIFDIIMDVSLAVVPTFAQALVVTQKRYFGHRTVMKQDEYLYISVKTPSGTINNFNNSDVLIDCQYYVRS